jgi:hypothetical protein
VSAASASSPSSAPGEGDLQEKLPDLSRTLAERILGRSLSDEDAARSTTESYVRSLNSSESSETADSSSSNGSGSTAVGAGSSSGSSGSTATETREG